MGSQAKPMIEIKQKIGARFKAIKRKVDAAGNEYVVEETNWFDNLVLDRGLNSLSNASGNVLSYLWVGTGNSTPDASQTGLDSPLASTSTNSPTQPSHTLNFATVPFYAAARRSFRFGAGQAVGTLSELGLGQISNSNLLFNRALIRDNNGNPSTITVLSDEILDVIVEMRVYYPDTISGSFDLIDKVGNVLSTVNYTGKPFLQNGSAASLSFVLSKVAIYRAYSHVRAYSGVLNAGYTTTPQGTSAANNSTDGSESLSYPTARSLLYSALFGTTLGNFNHKSLTVGMSNFLAGATGVGFQMEFDNPIPKTASDTLEYTVGFSWDRYVA